MCRIPSETLDKLAKEINKKKFQKIFKENGINDDRLKLLIEIIKGNLNISYPDIWDIERFVLKCIFPDEYKSLSLGSHCYSFCDLYEYDPPKNGQNIIKHGLSFGEVVSYSKKFGTLSVLCPDEKDRERVVIFSDLNLKNGNISLPFRGINFSEENYTLSIAENRNGKFRFISSRLLSKNNYKENMKQAFKNIYKDNKKAKDAFVSRCVEIIERDLLKSV